MLDDFKIGDKVFYENSLETIIHIDTLYGDGEFCVLITSSRINSCAFRNAVSDDANSAIDDFITEDERNKFMRKFKLTEETFIDGDWYEWASPTELTLANPLEIVLVELRKEIQ